MSLVCYAAAEEFEGCVSSCRNAAAVLGGTWAAISASERPADRVLYADLLVLSSWDRRYETILAERRGPTVPRWHSTILQTELAQETAKLARVLSLLDRGAVPALAVDDPALSRVLHRSGVVYLPNVLGDVDYIGVQPARLAGINVSLFSASHWRKNLLVQSAAFDCARREPPLADWTLHLNGQSRRGTAYSEWLASARIPYVDHGWRDRSGYLSLLAGMDVGLCATLSESYCYVAADHIALGVPVVASPAVACLDGSAERVQPDDVSGLSRALLRAVTERADVVRRQRRSLDEQARVNSVAARAALYELTVRAGTSPVS
jgi:glycosyltransferase involved in cell wall biosynthesis